MFSKGTGAIFDNDAAPRYRYALWHIWDMDKALVMFIGLNPSMINEKSENPTLRRVIQFAKDWGYGGVVMTNLYAYITPYPDELKKCKEPTGAESDKWLKRAAKACDEVVFAWGRWESNVRVQEIIDMFPKAKALVINKNGTPRHPLYVKSDTIPVYWSN